MKKIMILMLSLAVLFSFAACDNSSNTPEPTPGPGESVTVSDEQAGLVIGRAVDSLVAQISKMLPSTDAIAVSGQTASYDDSMTLTVTKTVNPAGEGTPAETVKLTVSGIDTSVATATGTSDALAKKVTLNTFKYEWTGYTMKDGMVVDATATINGYFTGDITAKVFADKDGQHYTTSAQVATENIVLPKNSSGIEVTVDGQPATGSAIAYAWDQMVLKADGLNDLVAFSEYLKSVQDDAITSFTGYANRLIDATTANETIIALLNDAVNATDIGNEKLASFANDYAAGKATYTFSVSASDKVIAAVASPSGSDVRIRGAVNKPITVEFSAEEAPTDPTALLADSFTISGTFVADTYNGSDDYENPVEFTATLTGNFGKTADKANTISITLDGAKAKAINPGTVKLALDEGSEMSATIPVGPVYVAGADYSTDKSDVVLQSGSVELDYDVANTEWKATATASV